MPRQTVLVTGGAGYVGSHTILELLSADYAVVCVDNLCNAYKQKGAALPESLVRVQELTGKGVTFYDVDIRDREALMDVFAKHKIDCVAHFAALKAVGESCKYPLQYYQNNITGTSILLEVMAQAGCFNFVYSSSATVYGEPNFLPLTEDHPTGKCTSPYGKSKYFTEEILKDLCESDKRWTAVSLRYFNPVGAHPSGRIGEDPSGEPNNLMPYISQVAVGRRSVLRIYGTDYPTKDGTGVRDYIHIVDLALGHVKALDKLATGELRGFVAYNLGTGAGYSVLEMVNAFADASGQRVPFEECPRRAGDIAESYADASLAAKKLNWRAQKGIREMCADTWNWQQSNPNGYAAAKL
ncbi:UDP-glucose 4-epimerase [Phlebotomus argentipes]|uniref:UDP-glucose 4-epimerase n=1 Tax=Phlebotomus argentipes TaxID=94469 RepID=UPI00289374A3|nr:UDP-glucose 4-epimerase [Phlebotomus argentipes]